MAKSTHVHKLKRHKFKTGNAVYFCALPDCRFKTATGLALGKRSICWRCGKDFIMNEYSIRLAKPHCDECHKSKDAGEVIVSPSLPDIAYVPDEVIVNAIPEAMKERINDALSNDSATELKNRLSHAVSHANPHLIATPDEDDI